MAVVHSDLLYYPHMKLGAHVSAAGGVDNAPANALSWGCECFQFFSRSPQGGPAPALTDEIVKRFKGYKIEGYIHTPYFINFGSPVKRIYHGSITIIRQELERASLLGVPYVMTHLGSARDNEDGAVIQTISGLIEVLTGYTGSAMLLLENAAGAGHVLGADFAELGAIIAGIKKKTKVGVGVCFDTCHAFASGYDLRTAVAVNATLKEFDHHVGLSLIKLLHLNDSLVGLEEKKDRHANIGAGKIGKAGIAAVINQPKLRYVNAILETPDDDQRKKDLIVIKKLRKGKG